MMMDFPSRKEKFFLWFLLIYSKPNIFVFIR